MVLFTMNKFDNYKKNPSVVCTELDDGAVLLNLVSKYYYSLNQTGLRIWQIIEEFQSPLEIAKSLADEYEIDAERTRESVVRLIEKLEKEGLIIPIKGGD
jgi:coenzyme PQQ synthesis protein D (PqqD)